MLRFAFNCNYNKAEYCLHCNGCRDRNELIKQARQAGLDESGALVFADLVIKNTATPQEYGEVIASVDAACDLLLKRQQAVYYKLKDWIRDAGW